MDVQGPDVNELQGKVRSICTYHGEEGTSGYLLSEEQFKEIFDLLAAEYRRGALDALEEVIDSLPRTEERTEIMTAEVATLCRLLGEKYRKQALKDE